MHGSELSITRYTIWFTSFMTDGQNEVLLRVDYDGDLELIVCDEVHRGRISGYQEFEGCPMFTTMWDSMDNVELQFEVHRVLDETPPSVRARLQILKFRC